MKNTSRILLRFVVVTVCISMLLVAVNAISFLVWNAMSYRYDSPTQLVRTSAAALHPSGGDVDASAKTGPYPYTAQPTQTYQLDSKAQQALLDAGAWAMLIGPDGSISWSENLPDEIPRQYSLTDVAKFTRYYLKDYPVYSWEHDGGLFVLGMPKDSFARYTASYPANLIQQAPMYAQFLFLMNLALSILLALLAGWGLIRSVRPVIGGITALAEGTPVSLRTKGLLRGLSESLNRASQTLQDKDKKLTQRDTARSNWIAGVSHDIRTPLSMILGYSGELEDDGSLPTDALEKAGIIRRQAERIKELVADLNLVSMLEYEMQLLTKEWLRPAALLRETVASFVNNDLDGSHPIELDIQDESLEILADRRLLKRALANLIQNSITHNPGGCMIFISLECTSPHACELILRDNGAGISEDAVERLTALPYTNNEKLSGKAHGLGLPIALRIIRAHGGDMKLKSATGQGFQAIITLPLAEKMKTHSFDQETFSTSQ